VDPDLKQMLDRRAEDMRLAPDLPPVTRRRAHRRRGWSVAFASMTVLAVITGTVALVQTFGTTTTRRIGQSPTPPAPSESTPPPPVATGDYAVPAIWPETNLADIQAEQAAVDAGSDSWRTDPAAVGQRFAHDVAGWDDVAVSVSWIDPSNGLGVVHVVDRATFDTALTGAMTLDLAQVGRKGAGGVWSVEGVGPDAVIGQGIDLSCGTDPFVRGAPATLCGTLSPALAAGTTIRYALFDGDGFDVAAVDPVSFADATDQGTMVIGLHDRFQTEFAGPLDTNASLLLVEVLDSSGGVVAMLTQRIGRQRAPVIHHSLSPTTTGPEPTTAPSTGVSDGAPPAIARALWPVVTPARLDDLGQDVANGKADYALQADTTAKEFAVRMLGWPSDRVTVEGMADGIVYRGVPGVQAIVQNADLGPSTALIVDLEPATAGGRTVWLVVGVQSELFHVLCPPLHQSTLDTSSPLDVCGAVAPTAAVPAIASATVEYIESEMQPSEAQSLAAIKINGVALQGRLQFNAAYANSDVSFVVRLIGSAGTVLAMEARRLHVA